MCWSCNPLCGGCKPPRKKAVQCPECGTYNVFDIQIKEAPVERRCKKCDFDVTGLATPLIVSCKNSGKMCANPCRKHSKESENGKLVDCKLNTPPSASREPAI